MVQWAEVNDKETGLPLHCMGLEEQLALSVSPENLICASRYGCHLAETMEGYSHNDDTDRYSP